MILNVEALSNRKLLIWRIAPVISSYFLMELLSKGFGKSISESLHHHIVVVISGIDILFTNFLLLKSCRYGKESNIISFS